MIAVKLAKKGFIALFLFSRHIGGNIFVIVRSYNDLHTRPALDRQIDIFFTNKTLHVITSLIIPYPIASHFYAVLVIIIVIRIIAVPFFKSYWISIPAPNKMSLNIQVVCSNPNCAIPTLITAVIQEITKAYYCT